jgi:hypothetical protein
MTNLPAAAGRRSRFDTARDRLMGNPVTRLGARPAIAEVTDRAARLLGGARG